MVVFVMFLSLLQVAMMAWPVLALIKMFSVRGTRQRYVVSSFERFFRYPNIIAQITVIVLGFQHDDWMSIGMGGISFTAALFIINHYFGDDEDDFWKGRGAKLRQGVVQLFSNMSPATGNVR